MCFENLPIRFDREGRATLAPEADFGTDPGSRSPRAPLFPARGPNVIDLDIEPVTRVSGALAFHTEVDLDARVVVDARSIAVMFRGYELILNGRDPLQAIDISSRACGVCGAVHSTCAAMALEMVFGAAPPPLAMVARNLAEAAELLYDHCLHLFLLAGPDYSEAMVRKTNPTLWKEAERRAAPGAATHGFVTIGDLMSAMNPLEGRLYLEALEVTRHGREIVSLAYGKYPHPSTVIPAGLGTRFDHSVFNQVLARIVRLFDYAKKVAAVWQDLVDFFYDADPRYREVGVRRANLISTGIWDDPVAYDASFERADEWGLKRLSTPGAVVDGSLRSTALTQISTGIEEFVDHSFYERWDGEVSVDPLGRPLSPHHPWNKRTIPRPEAPSWKERYSWSTAPRWDREPMESGPLARQWMTARAGLVDTEFIHTTSRGLEISIPAGKLPEATISWEIPPVVNALERNLARAVHIGYCLMVAYDFLLRGLDLLRTGETSMSAPFEPRDGFGVGFWEGGRGALTHYCSIRDGKLANYQILTPSTWMASPRDPWDVPGPYEEAVVATPILEDIRDRDHFIGIDVLRTIRSFDPCLPCAVHLDAGDGIRVVDATTCACEVA